MHPSAVLYLSNILWIPLARIWVLCSIVRLPLQSIHLSMKLGGTSGTLQDGKKLIGFNSQMKSGGVSCCLMICWQCVKNNLESLIFCHWCWVSLYSMQTMHNKPPHLIRNHLCISHYLHTLHKAWAKHAAHAKYINFVPALNAGLAKIEEYYDQTTQSDAYTFAMHMWLYYCVNLDQC